MCVCECACFVLCFSCLRSAAVSLQGNLTFNCCAEVALPDVPVLMRREDEETAACRDKKKKKKKVCAFTFYKFSDAKRTSFCRKSNII